MPPTPDLADAPLLRACRGLPGRRGCRCGSCARPGGRCPSTGPCGARAASSTPSTTRTWPPRSRSSRSAATASTPPSSTATSSCRPRPSASASTSRPASGPVVAEPFRTEADLDRLRPLEPEVDAPYVQRDGPPRRGRARRHAAHRLRRRPVHRRQLPDRGPAVAHLRPHQGDAPRRPRAVRRSCSTAWPTWPSPRCGPRSRPGASAIQLFDSWAGALSPDVYERARAARPAPRCSPASPTSACPASTSAWAPASCSP